MVFGIPLTPFNVINFCVLALTVWVLAIRYSRSASSNIPLFYWAAIIAHMTFFEGGYDAKWIYAGAICTVIVRFEFMADVLVKILQAAELVAIGYVVWRTIGLILLW